MPWTLRCPWCSYRLIVNGRGQRGSDPGSGVVAAKLMEEHAAETHARTWADFLAAPKPVPS